MVFAFRAADRGGGWAQRCLWRRRWAREASGDSHWPGTNPCGAADVAASRRAPGASLGSLLFYCVWPEGCWLAGEAGGPGKDDERGRAGIFLFVRGR